MTTNEIGPILHPVAILQNRIIIKGDNEIQQVLVQWDGLEERQATWEDWLAFKEAYPDSNLGDKVGFNGGGKVISKKDARTEVENCPQYENSVSKVGQLAEGSKDTECKTVRRE